MRLTTCDHQNLESFMSSSFERTAMEEGHSSGNVPPGLIGGTATSTMCIFRQNNPNSKDTIVTNGLVVDNPSTVGSGPNEHNKSICTAIQPLAPVVVASNPNATRSKLHLNEATSGPCRVRSRYLQCLGITKEPTLIQKQQALFQHKLSRATTRNPHNAPSKPLHKRERANSFSAILKGDHGMPDETLQAELSTSCSSNASISSATSSIKSDASSKSLVSFESSVTVHPIPAHWSYSDRIRGMLWTPPTEMHVNVARNCIEFAAENWDYRQVYNDEDMVLVSGGEKIHPVHFVQTCTLQRQLMTVLSAQIHHHSQHQSPNGNYQLEYGSQY